MFELQLVLSFVTGGLWLTLVTILAERLGSRRGGWIGGLPAQIVVSLLFTGLGVSEVAALEVTIRVPIVMSLNSLFLVSFAFLSQRSFAVGFLGAALLWTMLAAISTLVDLQDMSQSLALFALLFTLANYSIQRIPLPSLPGRRLSYTPGQLAGRAGFAGLVTVLAVALTRWAGPGVGALFAAFPTAFTSTLWLTYLVGGLEFARAIAKPLMWGGVVSVVAFVLALRGLFPLAGLYTGMAGAYLISVTATYLVYRLVRRVRPQAAG